ncbi:hypothetical protein [Burkholderia vietnamiensis]|uniref:hypothetical protein n=1 Tax=Burkholderia vietnamiensis TaxID=60552 RepID=UPI0015949D27|nr:hypothetical protein [Burkholderia vietnamiensis]
MKKFLLSLSLLIAAAAAHAQINSASTSAKDDGQNATLTKILSTNVEILSTLRQLVAQQSANGPSAPASQAVPSSVYKLSGNTAEAWSPEGVWADDHGVHARFKVSAYGHVAPDMILAQQADGSYKPVGLTFWPVGVVDIQTRAKHVLFRKGDKEVRADVIDH